MRCRVSEPRDGTQAVRAEGLIPNCRSGFMPRFPNATTRRRKEWPQKAQETQKNGPEQFGSTAKDTKKREESRSGFACQAALPITVVPRRVHDCENDDGIVPHDEEEAVGKPSRQHPSHFRLATQQWEQQRRLHRPPCRNRYLLQELQTQALCPLLVPQSSVGMSASASARTTRRRLMPLVWP